MNAEFFEEHFWSATNAAMHMPPTMVQVHLVDTYGLEPFEAALLAAAAEVRYQMFVTDCATSKG